MPTIAFGDKVPDGDFSYVPYTPALDDHSACGVPSNYNITEKWGGKKVVVFAVPGAFTPTCHKNHLPGYVKNYDKFRQAGVEVVAVIAANDPFVMSGWARVEGLKDKIVALTDSGAKWSKSIGLDLDLTDKGLGIRTGRYALVLDNLVVKHIANEIDPGAVDVTGAEELLKVV